MAVEYFKNVPPEIQSQILNETLHCDKEFTEVCPLVSKLWKTLLDTQLIPLFIRNFRNEQQIPTLGLRSIVTQFLTQVDSVHNTIPLRLLFKKLNLDMKRVIGPNAVNHPALITSVNQLEELIAQEPKTNLHALWRGIREQVNALPHLLTCRGMSDWMNKNQQALRHIDFLDFTEQGLTAIPAETQCLPNLLNLYARDNFIQSLPSQIGTFKRLQALVLGHNKLRNLPEEIEQLNQLQTLILNDNKFQHLSAKIGTLTQLRTLMLNNNEIQVLPIEIKALTQLTDLNLNDNKIEYLPSEIGYLTKLTELRFNRNAVKSLPPQIGQLTQLNTLLASGNQLQDLPLEFKYLTRLKRLHLNGNRFLNNPPLEISSFPNLQELIL
jgi:Leucine-rich repeat (LRR) protein